MPRPKTRVTFCQEAGRIRSLIARAQKEHLRPPKPLIGVEVRSGLARPTDLERNDARAAYWCERAIHALNQAEQAWDDKEKVE